MFFSIIPTPLKRTFMIILTMLLLATLLGGIQPAQAASELFFSEYIEGTSNNKALEIYNSTGVAVNLATGSYNVQMYFNGSTTAALTINLTGSVADGDVYVLAQASANATILAQADQTNASGWFNGDDAVVLRKGTTIIDVIGQIGLDPGTEWGTGLTSTADNTLRRKATICQGDINGADAFDPALEWDGFATDTFAGLGSHTATCGSDTAPTVTGTTPSNGATNVAVDADIQVTFSENVNVSGTWFTIVCGTSGSPTATVSGGPQIFTLNPDVDFVGSESCTVTILASQVTDQDTNDPPDNMAADVIFSFSTADVQVCGDPATLIHTIQGNGLVSPLNGTSNVSIEGVVVGDYQSGGFNGYFVQEETGDVDADPLTSEGIFVFDTNSPVNPGDIVRVRGNVTEFFNLTELNNVSTVLVCNNGGSVPPTTVSLPVTALSDFERFEGMLVSFGQDLTVSETFSLGRFGELSLSVGGRLANPTNIVAPGAPAIAQQDLNNRSRIILDDANTQQNRDPTQYPTGGLSALNTLRSGYTVTGLTGLLDERFGTYRIQPVGAINFTASNPRTGTPEPIDGAVKVASFNVLNYFNGDGLGGGFPTPRGATTPFELTRQRDKIISAITTMNADVIGLMELENDAPPNSAIEDLVNSLNAAAGAGTYNFIDTGIVGTDQIRVGIIYKSGTVTPVGPHAILDAAVNPLFDSTKNRPAIAQTFNLNTTKARFTVVVNHLKSKGSDCNDVGDPDTGDGQGNCNMTRTNAATALTAWLGTDPTDSGDLDFLIIGDLNSYAMEHPITVITNAGYTNLIESYIGAGAYSFVFQGQSGYLDHALSSPNLTAQASGVTEWHINADEPIVLDYNVEFKAANHINTLYAPTPYRSSDHDPVLVGLDLNAPPVCSTASPSQVSLWPANHKFASINVLGVTDPDGDAVTITINSIFQDEPVDVAGNSDGNTTPDGQGVGTATAEVRAERDDNLNGRVYHISFTASDGHSNSCSGEVLVKIPKSQGNGGAAVDEGALFDSTTP